LREAGFATLILRDSRLDPRDAASAAAIAGVRDHTEAEWGLWVNRPLLGQWVFDILRWLDFLDDARVNPTKNAGGLEHAPRPYVVFGGGAMSLPALLAAGLDSRVAMVRCDGCLVSFVAEGDKPWSGMPMGLLAPNILDAGDVDRLAALVAPRPLMLSVLREPEGGPASRDRVRRAFAFTRSVYQLFGASNQLGIGEHEDGRKVLPELKGLEILERPDRRQRQ
jgi:hypothetical protein